MVPYVYPNQSRDFQIFLRYYNYIFNGVKHDIDQIKDVVDTEECNNKILYLLQSKVGFFSNAKLTDDELRHAISAFPYIIRNKGSRKAISQAINVFCKTYKIDQGYKIIVYNKDTNKFEKFIEEEKEVIGDNKYIIVIELFSTFKDTTLLTEIFRYILPPTYDVVYMFMSDVKAKDTLGHLKEELEYIVLKVDGGNDYNMKMYNTDDYFGAKYDYDTDLGVDIIYPPNSEFTENSHLRSKLGTSIAENFVDWGTVVEAKEINELQQVTEGGNSRQFTSQFVTKIINYENKPPENDQDYYGHRVGTTHLETSTNQEEEQNE